ncbi:MAG TPA: ethylbenzene dehydrogenase-related protein [Gammaproteobacteria bacterium]|nr:ethylbenzene dehydrogenase-related protein [Gammaproteobacteria bacterium]
MRFARTALATGELLAPDGAAWQALAAEQIVMVPTPLRANRAIARVSPFLAQSTDHGRIGALELRGAHNGVVLALRLEWQCERHDRIADLDRFVDGVAVMFPLAAGASAVSMGAPGAPVEAWYWRADHADRVFEVIAEGYGTSARRAADASPLRAAAAHRAGRWCVVLARALEAGERRARLQPGSVARLAFAVWDGGNRERAGRKAFSGEFMPAELAP